MTIRGVLEAAVGPLVAILALILYLRTLASTVLYYDYRSMRDVYALQVKAYVLGIADAIGCPIYAMFPHLFTFLPLGEPAYRINLA